MIFNFLTQNSIIFKNIFKRRFNIFTNDEYVSSKIEIRIVQVLFELTLFTDSRRKDGKSKKIELSWTRPKDIRRPTCIVKEASIL